MEGPSIHAIADELQMLVNHKIKKVFGNAHIEKELLINQKIKEIYAFGKRLIIQCEKDALITHFLMYGSYRIDTPRDGVQPRIALVVQKNELYLYNCSSKLIKDPNVKKTLNFKHEILSEDWDIAFVIALMKQHPEDTIEDILLDQDIFTGVGNIIKNEALFMSKIAPQKKIKQLSAKKMKEIALNARAFSFTFLESRKWGDLRKNLLIYRKKECPTCGSHVVRKKTGTKKRWSFYCPQCQK